MNREPGKERITEENIARFLSSLQERGRSRESMKTYRQTLELLSGFLPEDKRLTAETGPAWRAWMAGQGLAPRTVNARV